MDIRHKYKVVYSINQINKKEFSELSLKEVQLTKD